MSDLSAGIRYGYPRLAKRISRKLAGYIALCRPFTLLAPLMAGIFGVLAPVSNPTFEHVKTAIYVGVTLALAQATGQIINQYADADLDRVVKPYRPIPSGAVDREEAIGLAWLLAMFAVARGFTVTVEFGLFVIALLFFAVFYSLAPLSPRRVNPFLNTAWMAVSRGFIPMIAVLGVYGDVRSALPYALLAFVWVLAYQPTKDIPDAEGDRAFGIRTIPSEYGLRGYVAYASVLTALFYAVSAIELPQMIALLPLSVAILLGLGRQSKYTENTIAWVGFYVGLGLIYVVTYLTYR